MSPPVALLKKSNRFTVRFTIMALDGMVPQGVIIPVSAHMLSHIDEYDLLLEKISKPLMQRINYDKTAGGEIAVINPGEVIDCYRYPDLTEHCIYLARVLIDTIGKEMPKELHFIQHYDEVKKAIQTPYPIPDCCFPHQSLIFVFWFLAR